MDLTLPPLRSAAAARERARCRAHARAIAARIACPGADFAAYRRAYLRALRGAPRPCAAAALEAAAARAEVVYVGDYHTLPAAQLAFCRLLRRLAVGRRLALALEFVPGRQQAACDAYLCGALGGAGLLAALGGARAAATAGWAGTRHVLALARRRRWPVLGIDSRGGRGGTLARRDAYAARRIAGLLAAAPGTLVAVLAGEMHVAPPHLPAAVARACRAAGRAAPRRLIVYQNSAAVLRALQRPRAARRVGCARLAADAFCLVHTVPSACSQSFLDWAEAGAGGRCDDG